MHEWVALIPGVVTVKARREAPVVRRVSNFLLELGAFVLFVTPCVDIALASNLALANSAYIPYAVPTTFVVVVSCRVEIKILRRFRPPRHRRDACSMAWRCRFLTTRPSQDGRVIAEK
jgi:hypothetical protein